MEKSIFIIEDNIEILYGLRDIFTSNDYRVGISDASEEIEEILKNIKKFKPRVVILDLVLPNIDGLELVKAIKSDDHISDEEIFIFTDLSDKDAKTRSVGLGANYYFMKNDFDIYTFSDKVMRIMERDGKEFQSLEESDSEDLVID
jgi:DNA-binding response OmpR family regulator